MPPKYNALFISKLCLSPFLSIILLAGKLDAKKTKKLRITASVTFVSETEYMTVILCSRGMIELWASPLRRSDRPVSASTTQR